jgi:predicted extracellular nuclease
MHKYTLNHCKSFILCLLALFAGTNAYAGAFSSWFGQCQNLGAQSVLIHQIQGPKDISPLEGEDVQVQGIITAIAPELKGFYIQEEITDFDNNPQTSEGIFVYSQLLPDMNVGDIVRVRGRVQEHFGMTQLKAIGISRPCGRKDIKSTVLQLPLPKDFDWEYLEGMHVVLNEPSVIINTYNYTRYNELTVSNKLLVQPTEIIKPSSPKAKEMQSVNARSKITIDDLANGAPAMNRLLIPIDAQNTLRIGSTIDEIHGVVDFSFEQYRVRVTHPLNVSRAPRPEMPQIKGNIKIATFNVLNLFNGNGQGEGFPTRRGADSEDEYAQQLAKIVNTLITIDADVVGLNELENDGFDAMSSIAELVDTLNTTIGSTKYAYIGKGLSTIGTDSISVGIIYQPASVQPVGDLAILTEDNSPKDEQDVLFNTQRNRPSFAQLFKANSNDKTFVINVNHLKSKGSSCGQGDDSVLQANCNGTRTKAAEGLSQWLKSEYPTQPIFIVGDLNSYALEDPLATFANNGFVNTVSLYNDSSYTYSFRGEIGSLDYILANKRALSFVVDAKVWHSNAAEPIALDYKRKHLRSDRDKPDNYRSDTPYRASDHDAVIIGLNF